MHDLSLTQSRNTSSPIDETDLGINTSGSEIRQTIPAQLRDSEKEGINSMVENTFLKDPNAYQNTRATPSFLNIQSMLVRALILICELRDILSVFSIWLVSKS